MADRISPTGRLTFPSLPARQPRNETTVPEGHWLHMDFNELESRVVALMLLPDIAPKGTENG